MNNKCTIKRKTWARGGNTIATMLCNKDNMKCCLGFYMKQVDKVPFKKLHHITPSGVKSSLKSKLIEGGFNSGFADDAMTINDDLSIPETQREKELTKLFLKNDTILEFID